MLIIIDKRMPEKAKSTLTKYGELLELETKDITYDAISGHPDIFCCKIDEENLVVAPNLSDEFINRLYNYSILFERGKQMVGEKYPLSAPYNAVITDKYLIHNTNHTDPIIVSQTSKLEEVHVNQAYTRCNLLHLHDDYFITSDRGIEKELRKKEISVSYFSPDEILLPGFNNGFFGGCCGVQNKQFFLCGSLNKHPEGSRLKDLLETLEYEIIELYDGEWFDVGSIIMLQ